MEWYLDASSCTLYHHAEGLRTEHNATHIGRIRFQVDAHSCDTLNQYIHVVGVCEYEIYMEIVAKHTIIETPPTKTQHSIEYGSGIGDSCQTLPCHIQRLVGNIPDMDMTGEWDYNTEQYIIVAIYGSVVFSSGYHSWVVATDNEHMLVSGGVPYDGDQLIMTTYRSEIGGIVGG
jgi:hypothetical protein